LPGARWSWSREAANEISRWNRAEPGVHAARAALLLLGLALCLGTDLTAQQPVSRFVVVDVFLNSDAKPLAAYQLEFTAASGTRLAGVEGGAHPAFQTPPYYDARALQQERVVLAAFNTAKAAELPDGKTRIATLHYQVAGNERPRFTARLQSAATVGGRKISATLTFEERKTP
jgi:hypothetical protein